MQNFINHWFDSGLFLFFLLGVNIFLSCSHSDDKFDKNRNELVFEPVITNTEPVDSKQVIIVYSKGKGSFEGELQGLEYLEGNWKITFDTIPCTVGRNGFAESGQKIEGDGKTPSGIFQIGSAFGYENDLKSKMDFIEISDSHYWISDTSSRFYNQLVDYYPEGVYAEKMKRNDHLYKYGVVIEYNTKDIIKGKGSAIFIHVERKSKAPTAGCVAISEGNMIKLIQWIDPEKHTLIDMGDLEDIGFKKYFSQ